MSLVFAGVCSHAPGITSRAHLADPEVKNAVHAAMNTLGEQLRAARPDAVIVVAAEHFANFFMNNMPSFAIGMADEYEGPIEDPAWLGIARRNVPGDAELSLRIITEVMESSSGATIGLPRRSSSDLTCEFGNTKKPAL